MSVVPVRVESGTDPTHTGPGGETSVMSTAMVPANMDEALKMLESAAGFLADVSAAELPA